MLLKRIKCLLCDFALIYLFYYGFCFINPWNSPLLATYFCFVGIYLLTTFLLLKRSLFQYLLGIEITGSPFAYTLLKILFLSIIPFVFTFRTGFFGLVPLIIFLFIINVISYPIKKKTIWELCTRAKLISSQRGKYTNSTTQIILFISSILFLITAIQDVLLVKKEETQKDTPRVLSFLPLTRTPFPVSQVIVKKYVNDIQANKQEPLNYIMQLFEDHDIVVLCERVHPEYTQWQLFSQIIFNDTFALKVGSVATEFGQINAQTYLDSLLNISFSSEEDRKKAFATIGRKNAIWPLWSNTNIYDFAVNLSKFNENKDKKQKVNWFFCDIATDWDNLQDRQDWAMSGFANHSRDSIMAANIISVFNNLDNKKLLVIENTHHAYKENRGNELTTADYLYQHYGEHVAFVWINNVSLKSFGILFQPYQMGVLDAAASQIKDSTWAVSFSNSILGEDHFELLPHIDKWHLKMNDLFNGMIYYLPPSQHYLKDGYKYILDDFSETLLKRNKIVFGEERGEEITNDEINNYEETSTRTAPYFLLFNLIFYIIHYSCLLILIFSFISILRKKEKSIGYIPNDV